jgi:hypothetical protein
MAVHEARVRTGRITRFPPTRRPAPNHTADAYIGAADAQDNDELVLVSGGGRMILVAALLGAAFWALLFWLVFG